MLDDILMAVPLSAIAGGLFKRELRSLLKTVMLYVKRPLDRDRDPDTVEWYAIWNSGNGKWDPAYVKYHLNYLDAKRNGVYVYWISIDCDGRERYSRSIVSFERWRSWDKQGPPRQEMA